MKTNEPCPHYSIVPLEQGNKITLQCTRCGKTMKSDLRKNGFDAQAETLDPK
jgi:hypothetical protein